jgi:mono/diheme cytochrome c family protein
MDNQNRLNPQAASPMFEEVPIFLDGRAMRPEVAGTVARGELRESDHYDRGLVGEAWAAAFPPQVTVDLGLLARGRERFEIYCTPCHGQAGYGDGVVHQRAMLLLNTPVISNGTSWVPPKSLHDADIRDQPVGQVFNTVSNGIRNMAGYAAQIPVADRWAIVAYVEALQRSQFARPGDVPDPASLPVFQIEAPGSEE